MEGKIIPSLRTISSVLAAFKAEDENTALTEHLMHYFIDNGYIHAPKVGNKYIVNFDELLDTLDASGALGTLDALDASIPKMQKVKPSNVVRLLSMAEVVSAFSGSDPGTLMCKSILRSMLRDGHITAENAASRWFIDLGALLAKFGAYAPYKAERKIPLLRTLEESEPTLKYTFRKYKLTTKMITDIVHSGEVFKVNYGNRWIINYSQLQAAIRKRFTADLPFEESEWERLQKDISAEKNKRTAAK